MNHSIPSIRKFTVARFPLRLAPRALWLAPAALLVLFGAACTTPVDFGSLDGLGGAGGKPNQPTAGTGATHATENSTTGTGGQPAQPILPCGDAQVQPLEGCDDGNSISGDGCDAQCRVEAGWTCASSPSMCQSACGDGIVSGGEQCDLGPMNGQPGSGCLPDCTASDPATVACGDGRVSGLESCDDGNTVSGDGCDAQCRVEAGWNCQSLAHATASVCQSACGDGIVSGGEQCDLGSMNGQSGSGCLSDCRVGPSSCGDGIVDSTEECDDGANSTEYGGCSSACTLAAHCGDGIVNGPEACDDGNWLSGDGCSASCQLE